MAAGQGRIAIVTDAVRDAVDGARAADRKDPSPLRGAALSRHGQLDRSVAARSIEQAISSDGFDHRPVLPEKCRGVVNVGRLHLDTASLSSTVVRHLKMEPEGDRLPDFVCRPAFAAHFGVPPRCVELAHFKFTIWLFVRRVGGEVRPAPERFRAKACPALDAGWITVRVKKTRQNIKAGASVQIQQNRSGPGVGSGLRLGRRCECILHNR
jgi:hypothetical protein